MSFRSLNLGMIGGLNWLILKGSSNARCWGREIDSVGSLVKNSIIFLAYSALLSWSGLVHVQHILLVVHVNTERTRRIDGASGTMGLSLFVVIENHCCVDFQRDLARISAGVEDSRSLGLGIESVIAVPEDFNGPLVMLDSSFKDLQLELWSEVGKQVKLFQWLPIVKWIGSRGWDVGAGWRSCVLENVNSGWMSRWIGVLRTESHSTQCVWIQDVLMTRSKTKREVLDNIHFSVVYFTVLSRENYCLAASGIYLLVRGHTSLYSIAVSIRFWSFIVKC